jgi:hypothetical protein
MARSTSQCRPIRRLPPADERGHARPGLVQAVTCFHQMAVSARKPTCSEFQTEYTCPAATVADCSGSTEFPITSMGFTELVLIFPPSSAPMLTEHKSKGART